MGGITSSYSVFCHKLVYIPFNPKKLDGFKYLFMYFLISIFWVYKPDKVIDRNLQSRLRAGFVVTHSRKAPLVIPTNLFLPLVRG